MKRLLASLLALCALLPGGAPYAQPQADFPAKGVHIINPFPPGSPVEYVGRLVAQNLEQAWGKYVIVESRSGAGGTVGANYVAKAAPDGHTLLVTTASPISFAAALYEKLPYDPVKDLAPVWGIVTPGQIVVVNAELPVRTLAELVAYAKANPGKLSYGVGNSTSHIVGEALKKRTQTDITRVAYRSNPMVMTDLLGGQIQIMIADFNTGIPQVKAGKVKPLAVLTRDRNPALPDVPTLNETVMPGYHILAWAGMFGPAGMPPEAVKKLADAVEKALQKPEVRQRFAGSGTDVYWSGSKDFAEFVKSELTNWTSMIKEAGIEPQ